MKLQSAVLFAWALISFACSQSSRASAASGSPQSSNAVSGGSCGPEASVPSDKTGVVVELTRTMCFGSCPAYKVTVYDDGKVHYEGKAYVVTMGGKDGKITADEVAKVRAAFDGTSFFSLCDTPEDKTSSTDAPDTNIYFSDGTRSKYLLTYWGNPRSARVVDEIAKRIDDIVHIEQYIGTAQEREKIPSRP